MTAADLDLWSTADMRVPTISLERSLELTNNGRQHHIPKSARAKVALPTRIRAVEVDMAGCSYNPEPEAHQDALAALVASEMKRVLQRELAPIAPPRLVNVQPEEDEIEALQVGE